MQTTRKVATLASVSVLISGCAAPQNTPGAGYGKNYTPVIDMQGADTSRYPSDLAACRKYAGYVDAEGAAMSGMLTGMFVAGALSAALGGRYQDNVNNATLGGAYGLGAESNKATAKQERIMVNCMAGRGYRTLDGGPVAQIAYVPQAVATAPATAPATSSVPLDSAPPPVAPPYVPPENAAGFDAARTDRVAMGYEPNNIALAGPAVPVPKFSYQAERLPEVKACNRAPAAKLIGQGPGMEAYSFACSNGDYLSVRCEFGNCRVLK